MSREYEHLNYRSLLDTQHLYVLDAQGEPQPVEDVIEWGQWMEEHNDARVIAHDRDEGGRNEILISTVFLGINMNPFGKGPPILFETMVFGGVLDQEIRRYATRAEAYAGHQEMCRRVHESLMG